MWTISSGMAIPVFLWNSSLHLYLWWVKSIAIILTTFDYAIRHSIWCSTRWTILIMSLKDGSKLRQPGKPLSTAWRNVSSTEFFRDGGDYHCDQYNNRPLQVAPSCLQLRSLRLMCRGCCHRSRTFQLLSLSADPWQLLVVPMRPMLCQRKDFG